MKRWTPNAAALVAGLVASPFAWAAPTTVPYIGFLTLDSGIPFTGEVGVVATLFDGVASSQVVWGPQDMGTLDVYGGTLSFALGGAGASALDSALLSQELWLEIELDGEPLSPRQRVMAVPYALRALDSDQLGGQPASAYATASSLSALALTGDVADLSGDPSQGLLADTFVQKAGDTLSGDLDFDFNRILDARMRVAASAPATCGASTSGLFYFDSGLGQLRICDGTTWVSGGGASGGGSGLGVAPLAFSQIGSQGGFNTHCWRGIAFRLSSSQSVNRLVTYAQSSGQHSCALYAVNGSSIGSQTVGAMLTDVRNVASGLQTYSVPTITLQANTWYGLFCGSDGGTAGAMMATVTGVQLRDHYGLTDLYTDQTGNLGCSVAPTALVGMTISNSSGGNVVNQSSALHGQLMWDSGFGYQ